MSENKKRTLKVYYGYHSNSCKRHPVIRLAGKYLLKLNFKVGDSIELKMESGRIVITKQ